MTTAALSLSTAAREYVWLYDSRHGMSPSDIAARAALSVDRVRLGLARARAAEKGGALAAERAWPLRSPRLVPMFPLTSYVPQSVCAHRRMLRVGSLFCCMVCHRTGIDGHPALLRDPRTDPSPEPKPEPLPAPTPAKLTRKQKRALIYGEPIARPADAADGGAV